MKNFPPFGWQNVVRKRDDGICYVAVTKLAFQAVFFVLLKGLVFVGVFFSEHDLEN